MTAFRSAFIAAGLLSTLAIAAAAEPLSERIEDLAQDAFVDLVTSSCVGGALPRPYTGTYFGILKGDPHLTEADRQRLNTAIYQGLGEGLGQVEFTQAEALGAAARLLGDQANLSLTLSEITSATFPVWVTTLRPAPDVLQLSLTLYARGAEGSYRCTKAVTTAVELPTLAATSAASGAARYLVPNGAYTEILKAFAEDLEPLDVLGLKMDHPGSACRFWDVSEQQFLTLYSQARGQTAIGLDAGRRFPPLDASGSAETVLELKHIQAGDRSFDLTATLRRGGQILNSAHHRVVVPPGALDGCAACAEAGQVFSLDLSPRSVLANQTLTVSAEVAQCEPFFFNFARSGKFTPVNTRVFDAEESPFGMRYSTSDETTYRIYLEEADAQGGHVFGVICSTCFDQSNPEQLKATLSEILSSAAQNDLLSATSSGMPFAVAPYEKLD